MILLGTVAEAVMLYLLCVTVVLVILGAFALMVLEVIQ